MRRVWWFFDLFGRALSTVERKSGAPRSVPHGVREMGGPPAAWRNRAQESVGGAGNLRGLSNASSAIWFAVFACTFYLASFSLFGGGRNCTGFVSWIFTQRPLPGAAGTTWQVSARLDEWKGGGAVSLLRPKLHLLPCWRGPVNPIAHLPPCVSFISNAGFHTWSLCGAFP